MSVVDLELNPPRITNRVVVGDGPEGLAFSPKGDVAVAIILAGSNNKSAYFYKRNGSISVLRISGKKVTKVGDVEVGGLPEGAAFTPDGKYLYIGNYLDQDLSILKVNGTKNHPGQALQAIGAPSLDPHEHPLSFCDANFVEKDRREAVPVDLNSDYQNSSGFR